MALSVCVVQKQIPLNRSGSENQDGTWQIQDTFPNLSGFFESEEDDDFFDISNLVLDPTSCTQDDCINLASLCKLSASDRRAHSGRAGYNFRVGLLITAEHSSERAASGKD